MRGYFAVGVDGISKPMNLGNLLRIAHAFDASFFFTVDAQVKLSDAQSDTSRAEATLPVYAFQAARGLPPARGLPAWSASRSRTTRSSCRASAIPLRAAYVFGSERMSLSPQMLERCEFVVKIPTRFSINVGMAGAIVLYDRLISLGQFAERPVSAGGPKTRRGTEVPPPHRWGAPIMRKR